MPTQRGKLTALPPIRRGYAYRVVFRRRLKNADGSPGPYLNFDGFSTRLIGRNKAGTTILDIPSGDPRLSWTVEEGHNVALNLKLTDEETLALTSTEGTFELPLIDGVGDRWFWLEGGLVIL